MAATSRLRDLGAFGLLFFKVVLFFNVAGQGRGGPSPASRQRVLPSPTPAAKGNGKFSQSGLKKKKMQKKTPKKPNPEPVQLSTRPHGAAPPPPGGVTCSRPAGRGRGAAERARSLWRGQRGLPPRTAGYRRPSKRGALPAPIHRRPETRCGQPGRGLWVAAPAAGPSEVNCVVSVRPSSPPPRGLLLTQPREPAVPTRRASPTGTTPASSTSKQPWQLLGLPRRLGGPPLQPHQLPFCSPTPRPRAGLARTRGWCEGSSSWPPQQQALGVGRDGRLSPLWGSPPFSEELSSPSSASGALQLCRFAVFQFCSWN